MEGKKDFQKMFSTCMEDPQCAEMMQKLTGKKGGPDCEGIMKSMMEKCFGGKEDKKEDKEEKNHD
jgi:hypothetical protein